MQEFQGKLLIGGLTLKHVRGELEKESLSADSEEWLLSGRLSVGPDERRLLQLDRKYRLELADGRAGQVVVSEIAAADDIRVTVAFRPPATS